MPEGPRSDGPRPAPTAPRPRSGLVVVSNRLPVRVRRRGDGSWQARASSGGLVTALAPVLRRRGGAWVGWDGADPEWGPVDRDVYRRFERHIDLYPVALTRDEQEAYYLRVANAAVWPVLHGLPQHQVMEPGDWEVFRSVNRRFARHVPVEASRDIIWVHDYHLMPLGRELRRRGARQRIGFFLHTPFPHPRLFFTLPHAQDLLHGLLGYDQLGFQTERDLENFQAAVESLPRDPCPDGPEWPRRETSPRLGVFPISIDVQEWAGGALAAPVAERVRQIRAELGPEGILVLGVDRLDHSKGLLEKLEGFRTALREDALLRDRATLLQLVVPSRERVEAYALLRDRLQTRVGEIAQEFAGLGRNPVRYVFGEWDRTELMAHYRAADIMLVTPIRDGMNLVSKEYCATRVHEPGVLVLSRHAGSMMELGHGALPVEPRDASSVARALSRAVRMSMEERRRRMGGLRRWIAQSDVHHWADTFLRSLEEVEPRIVPVRARAKAAPAFPRAGRRRTSGMGRISREPAPPRRPPLPLPGPGIR